MDWMTRVGCGHCDDDAAVARADGAGDRALEGEAGDGAFDPEGGGVEWLVVDGGLEEAGCRAGRGCCAGIERDHAEVDGVEGAGEDDVRADEPEAFEDEDGGSSSPALPWPVMVHVAGVLLRVQRRTGR